MDKSKPLCIDLCCGSGGWAAGFLAEGYRVIGFDICEQPDYPGEFVRCDVRDLDGWYDVIRQAHIIVASPPCEQFSRYKMPWTRKLNPPEPDLSVVEACRRISAITGRPFLMENVSKAQDWLGRADWHVGAYYLWGDVPALWPDIRYRKKESFGSKERLRRARIPFELARYIASCMRPA